MIQKGERFNSISHFISALASLFGLYYLIDIYLFTTQTKLLGILIYGISLFLMFLISSIYHGISGNKKKTLQILDHISIYILIAGSYTPFTLILFKESSGNRILISIWTIAALGILFKTFFKDRFDFLSTLGYLFAGWLVLFDLKNSLLNFKEKDFIG